MNYSDNIFSDDGTKYNINYRKNNCQEIIVWKKRRKDVTFFLSSYGYQNKLLQPFYLPSRQAIIGRISDFEEKLVLIFYIFKLLQ